MFENLKVETSPKSTEMQGFLPQVGKNWRWILLIAFISAVLMTFGRVEAWRKGAAADKTTDYKAPYNEGFKRFTISAESGNAEAQYCLGERYRIGLGATKDPVQALAWFLKAAEQEHVEAQTTLGLMYENGQGISKDRKEAFCWYRRAATQGNAMAQARLGALYRSGFEENETGRDLDQALIWIRKGAEKGDALAQSMLSSMLRRGEGMPVDVAKAGEWEIKAADQGNPHGISESFASYQWDRTGDARDGSCIVEEPWARKPEWFQKGADEGDAWSQYNLGEMYEFGDGVPKNPSEAFRWYQQSAALDFVLAQLKVAAAYLDGIGIAQDRNEALTWNRRAADHGNAEAQYRTGQHFSDDFTLKLFGETGTDPAEAAKWYLQAAKQGHVRAQIAFATMNLMEGYVARNISEAIRWYSRAAENGDIYAPLCLGRIYEVGDGVPKDHAEAVRWHLKAAEMGDTSGENWLNKNDPVTAFQFYQKSAEKGNPWSQAQLGSLYEEGYGVTKDKIEAVRWYQRAAEKGDPDAQLRLGWMYQWGYGVVVNPAVIHQLVVDSPEAFKLFLSAAKQGQKSACCTLGWMYDIGSGIEKNSSEASRWYLKAAELGHNVAQYEMGQRYRTGRDVGKNLSEAVRWYRKAAEQGNDKAQIALGQSYRRGEGVSLDAAEAARWYLKAAEQGNGSAQNNLGWMYDSGTGVEKSHLRAVQWYRKAAEQGNAEAQSNLAGKYALGDGVVRDLQTSARWYLEAANKGNAVAQAKIGSAYEDGIGIAKDWKEGLKWYRKSAVQGNAIAQFCIGKLYISGKGVVKDDREAVRWYRMAAESGYDVAQYYLGTCYSMGIGLEKDPIQAIFWTRKAAEMGNVIAQTNMGVIYENDLQDQNEAVRWYRKAAEQGGAEGQANLGRKFTEGEGVTKNFVLAYKWLLLAKSKLHDIDEFQRSDVGKMLNSLEGRLSATQMEEGQRLATTFSPVLENSGERKRSPLESEGLETERNQPKKGNFREEPSPRGNHASISFGTGFLISSSGNIVTAAHVVSTAKMMKGRLPSGEIVPLRLLKVDAKLDLAVLEADLTGCAIPQPLPIRGSRNLTLGQPVMTIGFPNPEVQGIEPKYTQGTISALTGLGDNPKTLQISVPVQPGNSGGALVDMSGNVVGVVVSRLDAMKMAKDTGALSENVNYAVKGGHLLAFLESLPFTSDQPKSEEKTLPLLAEPSTIQKVRDATIFIITEE